VERIHTLINCLNLIGLYVRNNNLKFLQVKGVVKETLKSILRTSSTAMTTSTVSKLSKPRSPEKDDEGFS
jgi:hypothetical protein